MKQHTFTGTFEGWMAESVVAQIRVNCVGELPDTPFGAKVLVTWDEPEPTDTIERVVARLRDRAGASEALWSSEEIAKAVVRDLEQAGWQIVARVI